MPPDLKTTLAATVRHGNAGAKLGSMAIPTRGRRRSWPELVVDLRDQGTGVLRAVALGRRWGGPWTFVLKVIRSLKLDLSGEFEFVQSLSARMLINPWVGRLGI